MERLSGTALLLLIAVVVFVACSDDDPVVANGSPCDDDGTACLTLRLTDSGMTYSSFYDGGSNLTYHLLSWDVASQEIAGFTPGGRVLVTVIFDPPVVVRYDHGFHSMALEAGADASCYDRSALATASLAGESWTNTEVLASCAGECSQGNSRLVVGASFTPLVTDDRLSQLTIDMTIPETYTNGASAGEPVLAGDLPITLFRLTGSVVGNNEGDPPAWQGTF